MKSKLLYLLTGVTIALLAGLFIFAVVENKSLDKEYRVLFQRHYKIFSPEVPAKMEFAGESVPLDIYYVREAFDREIMANTFMHSSSIMMFKRANRWFPVIEPILKKNGIPDDFKYVALAESNLGTVVSPSGAEGYWQFMKPTGQKYGLEINDDVDERYNMEMATEAACDYFKDAYHTFKNWTLVAASYNRGMDGIDKALEKQNVSSYYDLYLNDETSRYLFRILAIKQVYSNPVKYGLYLRERDFYPQIPTRIVAVDSTIKDLPRFAQKMKINYRILRELNPWLQRYSMPNKSGKIYKILLPKEGGLSYEALMKKVIQKETFFHDTLTIKDVH